MFYSGGFGRAPLGVHNVLPPRGREKCPGGGGPVPMPWDRVTDNRPYRKLRMTRQIEDIVTDRLLKHLDTAMEFTELAGFRDWALKRIRWNRILKRFPEDKVAKVTRNSRERILIDAIDAFWLGRFRVHWVIQNRPLRDASTRKWKKT